MEGVRAEEVRPARFRTTFNGSTRTVFRDGSSRLLVLDEYHGDLEVLAFQNSPGEAKHIGSQEIDLVFNPPAGGKPPTFKEMKPGRFHSGGKHKFVLNGSL